MLFSETPSADELRSLLSRAEHEGLGDTVTSRLRVILHFAEHHHSISETCRYFGISRSTFHRWIERFDPTNLRSLADRSHEQVTVRQSAVAPEVTELIRRYRMRYPQMGKEKISELLHSDHAVELSASTVARVIERECLYFGDTPFHWKKRLAHQKHVNAPLAAERTSQPEAAPVTDRSPEGCADVIASPVASKQSDTSARPSWPRFSRPQVGRFLVVSSIVTNLLFLTMLVLLSLFESSVSASVLPDQSLTQHTEISAPVISDRLQ